MSKISYNEGQLQKVLDRWMATSDDLAKFASTNKLAPEHVQFLQDATTNRTKELRRQLAIEHVESKVKLPSLSKSKAEDKTEDKAETKPSGANSTDLKPENKPNPGFSSPSTSNLNRPGQ
jgi:hypothetical protein